MKSQIKDLMVFNDLGKVNVNEVEAGEICAITGLEGFEIGDTVADIENPEGLPAITIDEPTIDRFPSIFPGWQPCFHH